MIGKSPIFDKIKNALSSHYSLRRISTAPEMRRSGSDKSLPRR